MIMHFIKIFLAGGFSVAAGLRAALSSVDWAHAHWHLPSLHLSSIDHSSAVQLAACVLGGAAIAIWSEVRRAAR